MGQNPQLPGFRFHPTDEELVSYYLARKVHGCSLKKNIISEVDPYKCEPWELPGKSCIRGRGSKLYFFSPTNGSYTKGNKSVRPTEAGYWTTTGRDQTISAYSGVRAIKKTKTFYIKHGGKTNWRMYEYILEHDDSKPLQDSFVLCKVFQKAAPKRDEGCTSEATSTEAGPRSSLGVESDSLTTQPADVFNPNVDCNARQAKTLMKDTHKCREDSPPPDDEIQMFLMRHLCDPDDLIPNTEENVLGEASAYENQLLVLQKVTSSGNGNCCTTDNVGNWHIQETVIVEDETIQPSSSLSDQDLSPETLEGDYIELNDLLTPIDFNFSS